MSNLPGARWWKFDFHAHSPASTCDYGKGPDQATLRQLTPREWLMAYIRAGIDCVAVTDHNSGEWIDKLNEALDALRTEQPHEFRELTLFPGVEITSNSDVHMLAIFGPGTPKIRIDELLGAVRLQGERGDGTAVQASTIEVADEVNHFGGLTILAHVDKAPNGANTKDGGNNSLGKLIEAGNVDGLELCDTTATLKPALRDSGLPKVLGSDCHHPDGSTGPKCPGSHFTWIKMGQPTLEGLRLALIDGDRGSVLRSDQTHTDPNVTPADWIESIAVRDAKLMGNGSDALASFSPYLNAIVGGRGTGKSTLIHLLRAALGRLDELSKLPQTESNVNQFLRAYGSRTDTGGLKETTEAHVVLQHAGKRFRISWTQKETRVEEANGAKWVPASAQEVRRRFPVRIFNQGQILELTGPTSTSALLDFVDDYSGASALKKRIEEEHSRFLTLRARVRELSQKAAGLDSVRAELEDVQHKLLALETSQHSAVLREHQRRNRQLRELQTLRDEARAHVTRIRALSDDLGLGDLPSDLFDANDDLEGRALAAYEQLRLEMESARGAIGAAAERLQLGETSFVSRAIDDAIQPAAQESAFKYEALVEQLRAGGVSDPSQFGTLIQDRHRLETDLKKLASAKDSAASVADEAEAALATICQLREELWRHRQNWVESTLRGNNYVRISVEPYGADPKAAARSFRELIGVNDERFSTDIFEENEKTEMDTGLAVVLFASAASAEERCAAVSQQLSVLRKRLATGSGFGGAFNNFLTRNREKSPELLDRLQLWSPEDGVRIEYSPRGDGKDFKPISQGSAGQRSAAVLAFFLAYGDEPLVLDQPEDDLDNHLIYDLIVQQLRESKKRRQVIVVTHNPNVVVNGYAELVFVMDFKGGQCVVAHAGCLQDSDIRDEVFKVMEGGRDAFIKRFRRLDGGRSV